MASEPDGWRMHHVRGDARPLFLFSCRGLNDPEDYEEFMRVVERDLGGVKTGELNGPYSTLVFITIRAIPTVIVLDDPNDLMFYLADPEQDHAAEPLANEILGALRKHQPKCAQS